VMEQKVKGGSGDGKSSLPLRWSSSPLVFSYEQGRSSFLIRKQTAPEQSNQVYVNKSPGEHP